MSVDEFEADIGVIGLGVMGRNLALNLADQGYGVVGYDRDRLQVGALLAGERTGGEVVGVHSAEEFVDGLRKPRRVLIMVPAGKAIDAVIADLSPLLESDDIVVDGGNSYFLETRRRALELEPLGIRFVGMGVSGGEEGARHGPSLMPGGSETAWPDVEPMFRAIAAKAEDGSPCCAWMGGDGAGHFVKMVHNGIEYSDMQLICEAYFLMHRLLGLSAAEMGDIFADWNQGGLHSYLIEITATILKEVDPETDRPLVDVILDTAGQKGTGKWTSQIALDLGVPAATMAEAVFARTLSAIQPERALAAAMLKGPTISFAGDTSAFVDDIRQALLASKVCAYAQGFALLRAASEAYGWHLNLGDIARVWRAGCIIRARFLDPIAKAFAADASLANLLLDEHFMTLVDEGQQSWRSVIIEATRQGLSVPAFSSALAYYDGYRCERLPANVLQAQRDFFGAHRFERIDRPRGSFFHHEWGSPVNSALT